MIEIKTLVSVDIPGDGAQALTEAIVRATKLAEEEAVTRLATKSDLALLKADLAELRGELKTGLAELKADLVRWIFGSGVTLTALIVGAVYFIVNLKH
ncbi:MAG: DUF1640 domain-containing protein [Verrucomicrobia bacterium]|nr:DUF1640 domain-containing protein [Verrucomicrobiota bacterium]